MGSRYQMRGMKGSGCQGCNRNNLPTAQFCRTCVRSSHPASDNESSAPRAYADTIRMGCVKRFGPSGRLLDSGPNQFGSWQFPNLELPENFQKKFQTIFTLDWLRIPNNNSNSRIWGWLVWLDDFENGGSAQIIEVKLVSRC